MDPLGQEAVQNCWSLLVENLSPAVEVLDFLMQHRREAGLTIPKYEELLSLEPRHKQVQHFLLYAVQSCPVHLLLDALDSGKAHRHLAQALRQELARLQHTGTTPAAFLVQAEVTSRVVSNVGASGERRRVADVTVEELTQSMTDSIARAVAQVIQLGKRDNLHLSEEESEVQGRRLLPIQGKQLRRDLSMVVDFPRAPGRVAVGSWRKADPLNKLCQNILHIQFGKVSFSEKELTRIRALLRHNPQIRDNADAGFLAAAMNVQFGLGDRKLGSLDDMERLYPRTRNPQLSLVVLLTMKGHQATVDGRAHEAQGYLDSARITSRQLEPCAETLYCLRTFACLKREIFYASGDAQDRRKLEEVLLHAKEVTDEMGVREDNSGTVMVLNRQSARFYMGYHPWKNPPFKGAPHPFDLQSAQHALDTAEECMRRMDRQPGDDSIHCLASAALCFLRSDAAKMEEWLARGVKAKVTYKNFDTDACRLKLWAKEQAELSERRE